MHISYANYFAINLSFRYKKAVFSINHHVNCNVLLLFCNYNMYII